MPEYDQTLSGALTIDDKALQSINDYEDRLHQLDAAIDQFVKSASSKFDKFQRSFEAAMPKSHYDIDISITGNAIAQLKAVGAAITKLNKSGTFGATTAAGRTAGLKFDEKQLSIVQKIDASISNTAITYKEITTRIRELTAAMGQLDALSRNMPPGKAMSDDSINSYIRAEEHVRILQERLKAFGLVYDEVRAKSAMDIALNMPMEDIEQARAKMQALADALVEFRKGGVAPDERGRTDAIRKLNEELQNTQAQYKRLTEEARRMAMEQRRIAREQAELIRANRTPDAAERLQQALGLDERSIEDIREKIRSIQRSSTELRRALNYPIGGTPELRNAANELDRLRLKMRQLKGDTLSLSEAANSAGRMMAGAFGAFQAFRFVRSIVDIYGRFQLMEKSLGVIIKDANRAREIFSDIQNMAIKSPFQVTELSDYAKQLAAFRFGVDELIPMTQKLADISAGLGVEMGRLILATGQVRAANYLKLTEVRQFTEAGVDLLGALAERFSEIERRAVTVGDVMQRITKRMVTFQDVDAVLTRMTSAGGTFYKMQEQQAETVFGLVSNLQDRWDLAMNQMGKSTDGLINGVIRLLIDVLDNAKELSNVLQAAFWGYGMTMSVALLSKGLGSVAMAVTHVVEAFRLFRANLPNMAIKALTASAGPLTAALGLVSAAVAYLIIKLREQGRLERELIDIEAKHEKEQSDLLKRYIMLTREVNDNSNSLRDRNRALNELKAQFGAILPLEDKTLSNIQSLNDAYDQHIAMIQQYVYAKAREAQQLRIVEELNTRSIKDAEQFAADLKNITAVTLGFERNVNIDPESVVDDLKSVYNRITQEILSGNEEWQAALDEGKDAVREKVRSTLSDFFGAEFFDFQMDVFSTKAFYAVRDVYDQISNLRPMQPNFLTFDTKAIETDIANIKKQYSAFLEELSLSGEYKSNPAAAQKQAQAWIQEQSRAIQAQIDAGDFGSEVRSKLENKLNAALAAIRIDATSTQSYLLDVFDRINRAIPGLEKPIGQYETEYDNQNLEEYYNAVANTRQKLQADLDRLRQAQADVARGVSGAQDSLNLSISAAAIKNVSDAEKQLRAYDMLLQALSAFGNDAEDIAKAAEESAKALQEQLKTLAGLVTEYYKAVGEADPAELEERWKQIARIASSISIRLPDRESLDKESLDEWIRTVLEPRVQDIMMVSDIKIKVNEESRRRAMEEIDNEVEAIKRSISLASRLSEFEIELPGMNLTSLYNELQAQSEAYLALGTKDAKAKADELAAYLSGIFTEAQIAALKAIGEINRKSADAISKLFIDYRKDLSSIKGVNDQSSMTGIQIDAASVDEAELNRTRKLFADISREMYDMFKGSELYIRSFGDIEKVSLPVLTQMRDQLLQIRNAQSELDAADAKALSTTLDKLDQAIRDRGLQTYSFIETVVKGLSDMVKAYEAADIAFQATESARKAANAETSRLREMEADPSSFTDRQIEEQTARVTEAQSRYNAALEEYFSRLKSAQGAQEAYRQRLSSVKSALGNVADAVNDATDLFSDFAEAFGSAISPEAEAAIDGIQKGFSLVSQALTMATAAASFFEMILVATDAQIKSIMTTAVPLLAIGVALSATLAIVNARDRRRKSQIEDEQRKVEALQKAYDSLMESMSRAMSTDDVVRYNRELLINLSLQRQALEAAIALENSRGRRRDQDNIRQMTEDLQELEEQVREVKEAFYETLGADTGWRELSSDFASSWLEAFRATGDGLDALRGDFDEYFENILIEQFALRSVAPLMERFGESVLAWLEDGLLDASEVTQFQMLKDTISTALNESMTSLYNSLGLAGSSSGTVETSSLQKGIQALTEDTGQALESLLNSVRFHVVEMNTAVQNAFEFIAGNGTDSPLMSEIKAQTALIRSIDSALSSVIRPGHRLDGAPGIRVFMD